MKTLELGSTFSLSTIKYFIENNPKILLSKKVQTRVIQSRLIVDQIANNIPVYGINTGFGKLASQIITNRKDLRKLQENLIKSHSVGTGKELDSIEIRVAILLLVNSLSKGYSGIRLEILELLIDLLNLQITPIVYEYGSLGASGDLVPLAHIALTLFNENPIRNNQGTKFNTLSEFNPEFVFDGLESKEGLALINGTHFTTAIVSTSLLRFIQLVTMSCLSFGMAIDALQGSLRPFRSEIHKIRPHPGQIWTAQVVLEILQGSDIARAHNDPIDDPRVQDPYSYRCFPQVMGGILQVISHSRDTITIELNSVTDNPIITPQKSILSGGNFHAEPIAFIADYLAIAVTKLMNIMEKQVEKLLNPATNFHLPPFLVEDSGLNSGFMIAHYTQSSLVNRSRLLSHPSSVDNVSVSANQEDHVSMGMNAALKFNETTKLFEDFLALHFLMTAQGLTLRKEITNLTSSETNETSLKIIREKITKLIEDRQIHLDLKKMKTILKKNVLIIHTCCESIKKYQHWLLTGDSE